VHIVLYSIVFCSFLLRGNQNLCIKGDRTNAETKVKQFYFCFILVFLTSAIKLLFLFYFCSIAVVKTP